MKKAIIYFFVGTVVSLIISYFSSPEIDLAIKIYNSAAFGLAWGLAYFVDHPEWPLPKKMGISLIGIVFLVVVGLLCFDFETAVPSIVKFSTVFVAYYMIASFRESKSLRY